MYTLPTNTSSRHVLLLLLKYFYHLQKKKMTCSSSPICQNRLGTTIYKIYHVLFNFLLTSDNPTGRLYTPRWYT